MVDPLAEKWSLVSPYSFVLNNPLKYFDYDGRDIILVGTNGRLIDAYSYLMKTAEGKRLYEKYGKSNTHDIYISTQDKLNVKSFGGRNYERTAAVAKEDATKSVKNGKIYFDENSIEYEFYKSFQSTDVEKSKGKKISLVNLYETSLSTSIVGYTKEMEDLENVETLHHEIVSHIEMDLGSSDKDTDQEHSDYGQTFKGNPLFRSIHGYNYQIPKSGSRAEMIFRQILELYFNSENKDKK
jgi:hypothetical protein